MQDFTLAFSSKVRCLSCQRPESRLSSASRTFWIVACSNKGRHLVPDSLRVHLYRIDQGRLRDLHLAELPHRSANLPGISGEAESSRGNHTERAAIGEADPHRIFVQICGVSNNRHETPRPTTRVAKTSGRVTGFATWARVRGTRAGRAEARPTVGGAVRAWA